MEFQPTTRNSSLYDRCRSPRSVHPFSGRPLRPATCSRRDRSTIDRESGCPTVLLGMRKLGRRSLSASRQHDSTNGEDHPLAGRSRRFRRNDCPRGKCRTEPVASHHRVVPRKTRSPDRRHTTCADRPRCRQRRVGCITTVLRFDHQQYRALGGVHLGCNRCRRGRRNSRIGKKRIVGRHHRSRLHSVLSTRYSVLSTGYFPHAASPRSSSTSNPGHCSFGRCR